LGKVLKLKLLPKKVYPFQRHNLFASQNYHHMTFLLSQNQNIVDKLLRATPSNYGTKNIKVLANHATLKSSLH